MANPRRTHCLVGMHWGRRRKKQSERECHQRATKFLTIHQSDISDCPQDQPLRRSSLLHAFHGARHTYLEHMRVLRTICSTKEYITTSGDETVHKSILPVRKHGHQLCMNCDTLFSRSASRPLPQNKQQPRVRNPRTLLMNPEVY